MRRSDAHITRGMAAPPRRGSADGMPWICTHLGDIRTLGPDPSFSRAKIIRMGTVASVAMAAALAWVWLTRRTVSLRTAQLAAANKQLDGALSQEREIGELKSRYVSLVSHEFLTPLGVTISEVELLRHYRGFLPKRWTNCSATSTAQSSACRR